MKMKCTSYKIGDYIISIDYNNFKMKEPIHIKTFKFDQHLNTARVYYIKLLEFNNETIESATFFENELGLKVYNFNEEYIFDYKDEERTFVKRVIYNRIKKEAKVYIYSKKIAKAGHHFIESTQFQMLFMLILAENNSFLLHSNLIKLDNNYGICFCGKSGNGKTTLSKLFTVYNKDCVLTDETVLISFFENKVFAAGTPWKGSGADYYKNEQIELKKIYLINHGKYNYCEEINNSTAVKELALQTFPYFWDSKLLYKNLNKVNKILGSICIKKLFFYPDVNIIKFIKGDTNV